MRIHVIHFQGSDEIYRQMLHKLRLSAAEFMPEAEFVVHELPPPERQFHSIKVTANLSKLQKQAEISASEDGDFILMDSDMLFTGSVEDAFEQDFDIAFTVDDYQRDCPLLNAGMLFCRQSSADLFKKWLWTADFLVDNVEEYNRLFKHCRGICQCSLHKMMEIGVLSEFKAINVSAQKYNHRIMNGENSLPEGVRCVHINSDSVRASLLTGGKDYLFFRKIWHKYPSIPTLWDVERFKTRTGYDCNIDKPETFNEKIQWKKHNARNPLIQLTSDKLAVRDYVEEKGLACLLPEIRWRGTSIHRDEVRTGILKSNNASGRSMWIKPHTQRSAVIAKVNEWCQKGYGGTSGEWGYQNILPECFIEMPVSNSPADCIKVLCFHGEPKYIYAQKYNRDFSCRFIAVYNCEWQKQDVKLSTYDSGEFDKPENLEYILDTARRLSEDFDFVRVDFMLTDGKLWFSEITHYPTSGQMAFNPIIFDKTLGDLWELTR